MITMSDVFKDTIIDNNGIAVSDINKGLRKYFPLVFDKITHNAEKSDTILVDSTKEAYPDLLAYYLYSDMSMWFFFLISNFIDDPFTDVLTNYVYYSYNNDLLDEVESNATSTSTDNSRIGTTIDLN